MAWIHKVFLTCGITSGLPLVRTILLASLGSGGGVWQEKCGGFYVCGAFTKDLVGKADIR